MHGQLIAADLLLCWELMDELTALVDTHGRGSAEHGRTLDRVESALNRAGVMLEGADDITRALYRHVVAEAEQDLSAHLALIAPGLETFSQGNHGSAAAKRTPSGTGRGRDPRERIP